MHSCIYACMFLQCIKCGTTCVKKPVLSFTSKWSHVKLLITFASPWCQAPRCFTAWALGHQFWNFAVWFWAPRDLLMNEEDSQKWCHRHRILISSCISTLRTCSNIFVESILYLLDQSLGSKSETLHQQNPLWMLDSHDEKKNHRGCLLKNGKFRIMVFQQ